MDSVFLLLNGGGSGEEPFATVLEIRHGPIIIYTRLPAGRTYYPICTFPASSECLIGISDAFLPFVYGYPSSSPCAHCTPNKSVPTLRYTRRHGPIYTGPCPKALTECSPLDFRRSYIVCPFDNQQTDQCSHKPYTHPPVSAIPSYPPPPNHPKSGSIATPLFIRD